MLSGPSTLLCDNTTAEKNGAIYCTTGTWCTRLFGYVHLNKPDSRADYSVSKFLEGAPTGLGLGSDLGLAFRVGSRSKQQQLQLLVPDFLCVGGSLRPNDERILLFTYDTIINVNHCFVK